MLLLSADNTSSTGFQTVHGLTILLDIAVGAVTCSAVIFSIILKKIRQSSARKNGMVDSLSPDDEFYADWMLSKNRSYLWLPPAESKSSQGETIYDFPAATPTHNQAHKRLTPTEDNAPAQGVLMESCDEPGKEEIIVVRESCDEPGKEEIAEVALEETPGTAIMPVSDDEKDQSIYSKLNAKRENLSKEGTAGVAMLKTVITVDEEDMHRVTTGHQRKHDMLTKHHYIISSIIVTAVYLCCL